MIIIQTEAGAIVTNPKEIYIDKDPYWTSAYLRGSVQYGSSESCKADCI